ncbi:hypothetical protein ES703_67997 [subsurface metagenome]
MSEAAKKIRSINGLLRNTGVLVMGGYYQD